MHKKIILAIIVLAALTSCNNTKIDKKKDVSHTKTAVLTKINQQKKQGYLLMKNNCYACHNPNATSHDNIIAPPFKAIKMFYSRKFDSKKEFVNAIVNWTQNPTEDKALMYGAVKKFKIMPKLSLKTKDLEKIATYLYDNDVEEPEWLNEHMKKKHKKGKGMINHKN